MRIAVYAGSFNPLHIGHLAIMRYLTEERCFDNIYLIVSPKNPLKSSISEKTGKQRYEEAKKAIARHKELNVTVDPIELTMPAPHYTINTLDTLKKREPENDFTLIIGADNLYEITKWKDFDRILTEYGVCVYPRKGYDLQQIKNRLLKDNPRKKYKIKIITAPLTNISSTEINEKLSRGEDVTGWLM